MNNYALKDLDGRVVETFRLKQTAVEYSHKLRKDYGKLNVEKIN